jgi:hypothetical protein
MKDFNVELVEHVFFYNSVSGMEPPDDLGELQEHAKQVSVSIVARPFITVKHY